MVDEGFDHGGRMLEVGIDHDDDLAARVREAGSERGLLAKISGQFQKHQPWHGAGLDLTFDPGGSIVAAAVIDDQDFAPTGASRERIGEQGEQAGKVGPLVLARNDAGEGLRWGGRVGGHW
jgi:hypothetical protein